MVRTLDFQSGNASSTLVGDTKHYADIAQLVVHFLGMEEVRSSNLLVSTKTMPGKSIRADTTL